MRRRIFVRRHLRLGRPVRAHFKLSQEDKRLLGWRVSEKAWARRYGSETPEEDIETLEKYAKDLGADERDLADIEKEYVKRFGG